MVAKPCPSPGLDGEGPEKRAGLLLEWVLALTCQIPSDVVGNMISPHFLESQNLLFPQVWGFCEPVRFLYIEVGQGR